MAAKDVRNAIITLIILAAAIKFITIYTGNIISQQPAGAQALGVVQNFIAGIVALSDLMILGLAILIVILIPVYFSKRSQEKKLAK